MPNSSTQTERTDRDRWQKILAQLSPEQPLFTAERILELLVERDTDAVIALRELIEQEKHRNRVFVEKELADSVGDRHSVHL